MENVAARETFIGKARKVHHDRYDYALVDYVNSRTKVKIRCVIHENVFEQRPSSHLGGSGCYTCGRDAVTLNKEVWITKCVGIHGNKYLYDKVEYVNTLSKVTITCKEHGDWQQRASNHIQGKGCPKCASDTNGQNSHLTHNEFIEKAKYIHGDLYSYDKTTYTGWHSPITVVCRTHGEWETTPNRLISTKSGCRKCAYIKKALARRKTMDEFLQLARSVHGDRYTYELVELEGTRKSVKVNCSVHGYFDILPKTLFRGSGCKGCANSGFNTSKPAHLYALVSGNLFKIGITNRPVEKRMLSISRSSGKVFSIKYYIKFANGQDARDSEKSLIKLFNSLHPKPAEVFDGSTECFIVDCPDKALKQLKDHLCTF